jgi:hypothetical protein
MFQIKVVEKTQYTLPPPRDNCASYEIMRKIIVEPGRQQVTIWRMRFACWIPKATDTHSENGKTIPFPPQPWLHEHAAILRYTYIACLVII